MIGLEAAFGIPRGKDGGVHRPRGGSGDAIDPEPRLFKYPVEHAPGESVVRSAALNRKINQNWIAI
jgi:hypothetical protein